MRGLQVVWLKRDLRLGDHRPLFEAARRGPCLALYVYEPEVVAEPTSDAGQYEFINQSLRELDRELQGRGACIVYRVGRMPDVLDAIHRASPIAALWSHQETGTWITYERDRRVKAWCREHGITWHEPAQNGVVRGLRDRDRWAGRYRERMSRPLVPRPARLEMPVGIDLGRIVRPEELGLGRSRRLDAPPGGVDAGWEAVRSFLRVRGLDYTRAMSSPNTAFDACSRLSPYLAWGCLSARQVLEAVKRREQELVDAKRAGERVDPRWWRALRSFRSRLAWRCHFAQKLEREPEIQFRDFCRVYDGIRTGWSHERFDAWRAGLTGFPLVDACMRALDRHGWINFRMRAMLVSFAAYHLWIDWRPIADELGRRFVDFDPGIHFPQCQMQSGTTGINTLRIYAPTRQSERLDPDGTFIRRWVPELEAVPEPYIHEPHRMPGLLQQMVGCRIGTDYPAPIVEHAAALRAARSRFDTIRSRPEAIVEARGVYLRHGSRSRNRMP